MSIPDFGNIPLKTFEELAELSEESDGDDLEITSLDFLNNLESDSDEDIDHGDPFDDPFEDLSENDSGNEDDDPFSEPEDEIVIYEKPKIQMIPPPANLIINPTEIEFEIE